MCGVVYITKRVNNHMLHRSSHQGSKMGTVNSLANIVLDQPIYQHFQERFNPFICHIEIMDIHKYINHVTINGMFLFCT